MSIKSRIIFVFSILFIFACTLADEIQPIPTSTPAAKKEGITAYPGNAAAPAPSATLTPSKVAATPAIFPRWVAEFSEPLLKSIESEHPAFADDFPPVCIDEYRNWKVCATPESRIYFQPDHMSEYEWELWAETIPRPTLMLQELPLATARPTLDLQPSLQNGYTLLNTGWFFIDPGAKKNPHYARIDNGAMVLTLPEGTLKEKISVFHHKIPRRNFVLQFDLDFYDTQPEDTARFEFQQGADENFALELSKNKTWRFYWGKVGNQQSRAGVYEYYALPQVRVLLIANGTQCAIYLNRIPLEYIENCRTNLDYKIVPQSVYFQLLTKPEHVAAITIDNVAVWELKK